MLYGSNDSRSTRYSAVPTSEGAESSKLLEEIYLDEPRRNQRRTWAVVALLAAVVFSVYTLWANSNRKPATSSSSSSSTSDSASPSTPDDIYGGGWTVVRCVSSTEGTWHPATDNLYGSESYGTYVNSYTTDTTFSATWTPSDYSTVLLGLTDLSAWVVADTSQLFVLGSPADATIIESSTSSTSYTVEWCALVLQSLQLSC